MPKKTAESDKSPLIEHCFSWTQQIFSLIYRPWEMFVLCHYRGNCSPGTARLIRQGRGDLAFRPGSVHPVRATRQDIMLYYVQNITLIMHGSVLCAEYNAYNTQKCTYYVNNIMLIIHGSVLWAEYNADNAGKCIMCRIQY